MTKRDLLSVAVKITGLALIVQMIFAIPGEISYFAQAKALGITKAGYDPMAGFPLAIASIVLYGGVGMLLVIFSEGIARLLVTKNADAAMPNLSASPRPWFSIATRVVGLLAITDGLPLLVGAIIKEWAVTSVDTEGWAFMDRLGVALHNLASTHMDVAAYRGLTQVIAGAYLVWGAEQFTKFVFRKKRATKPEVEQDA